MKGGMPMHNKLAVSFPHMGDYSVVFSQVLGHFLPDAQVFPAPPMTQRTLELGSRYSPDFVCSPFKYNLGNYIEALNEGANVLFQAGMGCRYGYYGELQKQILQDLGYRFQFVCLSREQAKPVAACNAIRKLGCTFSASKMLYTLLLACESIRAMDRYDYFMRENVGFEVVSGSFEAVREKLLRQIGSADSLHDLQAAKSNCKRAVAKLKIDRPENLLRVGMVGDLYTLMEPFSNFYVEKQLAKDGISVSRVMGVWFLLFDQHRERARRNSGGYLQHTVGANGVHSVSQSLSYAKKGYDGIIHMKSFGCIPELNATPSLMNLSRDWNIPILDLSFDTHTSEIGVQTRLEAFSDMIRMKKEENNAASSKFRCGHRLRVHQGGRA
jgi:predicted nucleotide-binding protein (sugar kinase/HSP70/actin superfamily)